MDDQPVSIIIRTLNERDRLKDLFDALASQDYSGTQEIIVVDTSSKDGTAELAHARGAQVITLTQEEFTYPRSMNLGVERATSALVVITVGHSLPFRKDWLRSGVRHFADPNVAGVFAPPRARTDATFAEKIFYSAGQIKAWFYGVHVATPQRWKGIMGATNCMFRRSLWEQHHFDEAFAKGGEDVAWAQWAMAHGYKIICDPKFSVRHSHGNDYSRLKQQLAYWRSLGIPRPFSREALRFRRDIKWNE
jgi:cellulose synthase/poly-beta-1,6-N-acetylglucosamine synthase-like glycosyltransferase